MSTEAQNLRPKSKSNIVRREQLREVQLETLERIAEALRNSYGPDGSTTVIRVGNNEKDTGISSYTKDGHRILSNIRFSFPIEFSIVDDLKDITRNTVKTVGDGTTSAVLMSYYVFKYLKAAHEKYGISEKKLANDLLEATTTICKKIEENGRPATLDDIYWIAYTSTDGNDEIASNIKELYDKYGMGVFIDVGISNTEDDVIKEYDGITINSGYFNTCFINNPKDGTFECKNVAIYIFEDPIDTPEMMALMETIMNKNVIEPIQNNDVEALKPTVIFSPAYGNDIRSYMDKYMSYMTSVQPEARPPFLLITNVHDLESLQDLATLSGAKLIKKYIDSQIQKRDIEAGIAPTAQTVVNFGGSADFVSADSKVTKIVNPAKMFTENPFTHSIDKSSIYLSLIESLEAKLANMEETKTEITEMNKLRRRIQSLKCNMVDYLIGGISYTDRDAIKDAVEDAVLNCRNAAKFGVGNGANIEGFCAANKLAVENKDEKYNIYDIITTAYYELVSDIYEIKEKELEDDENRNPIVLECVSRHQAYNLRTDEFDGHVLTSIKSDQVILDAISKIIGLMFKTNQYLVATPSLNIYETY